MKQEMTMEEIEAQFPSQWVLVGDPELDENSEVIRGSVLFRSANAHEFNRRASDFKNNFVSSIYVGEMKFWLSVWR